MTEGQSVERAADEKQSLFENTPVTALTPSDTPETPTFGRVYNIANKASSRVLYSNPGYNKDLATRDPRHETYESYWQFHLVDDSGDVARWWISPPVGGWRYPPISAQSDQEPTMARELDTDYRKNYGFMWELEDAGGGYYYIRHVQTGGYLCGNLNGKNTYMRSFKVAEGVWEFRSSYEYTALASLPPVSGISPLKSPKLDSCDTIGDYTPKNWQLVGWVGINPLLIKSNPSKLSIFNAVLKRSSRWRKIDWRIREGGVEESKTTTVTIGIEQTASTTVQETLNVAVTASAGLAVEGVTASISSAIEAGLSITTEISKTTSYTKEESITVTYQASPDGKDRASASWIREDRYALLNYDNVAVIPEWTVTNRDAVGRSHTCDD